MEGTLSLPRSERRRIEKLAQRTKEAIVLVRCRIVLKVAMGCSRCRAGRAIGCVPFLNLLRALLVAYRGMHRVHVILDNYGIHKSAAVAGFLRRCGETLRLHFLPPYCPDQNKIERIWGDVHANVTRNHRRSALRELLDAAGLARLRERTSADPGPWCAPSSLSCSR